MTLTTTRSREQYVGDGKQQLWPVPFAFLQPEHVKAVRTGQNGIEVALAYGRDYTVVATDTGGILQHLLPVGERLTIWREMPLTQELDLHNTGPLDMEAVERALDGITMQVQQVSEGVERAVKVSRSSSGLAPDKLVETITLRVEESHASASQAGGAAVRAVEAAEQATTSAADAGMARAEAKAAKNGAEASLATVQSLLATAKSDILAQAGPVPIGMEATFPVNTIPAGWLVEDGRVITKAAYPELVQYLTGSDTAQTATLPDMRGEFARGADLGRGVEPGRAVGSWKDWQMRRHEHRQTWTEPTANGTPNANAHNWVATNGGGPSIYGAGCDAAATTWSTAPVVLTRGIAENAANGGATLGNTGDSVYPRNIAKVWCIKAYNAPGVAQLADITTIMNRLDTQAAAVNPNVGKFCRIGLGVVSSSDQGSTALYVGTEMFSATQLHTGEDWRRDTTTMAMIVPEAGVYRIMCSIGYSGSSLYGELRMKVNENTVTMTRVAFQMTNMAMYTAQLAAGDVVTSMLTSLSIGGYYRDAARTWTEMTRIK